MCPLSENNDTTLMQDIEYFQCNILLSHTAYPWTMIIAFSICTKGYRGAEKVVCDICGKSVTTRRLQGHKNMHTLNKTIKCEIKGCDKKFRTEEELKR